MRTEEEHILKREAQRRRCQDNFAQAVIVLCLLILAAVLVR